MAPDPGAEAEAVLTHQLESPPMPWPEMKQLVTAIGRYRWPIQAR